MEASTLSVDSFVPRSRRLSAALSDERLAKEAKRGSSTAFEIIYDRYHRPLLAFCRHLLGSQEDAEDALQQTFTSAFRALPRNERPDQLKAWLYTIARNQSLTMLRMHREAPVGGVERASFEGLADEVERRADLRQIIMDVQDLPEPQRAALVLAEVSDLTHAEVADVLECEPKQVKSLVFQARTALAQNRKARTIPCAEIREEFANARGRELRASHLRRHVHSCAGCADFEREVRRQRKLLSVALPVIPSLCLRDATLGGVGLSGGGAAGGAAGGGGGVLAALSANGIAKVAAVAAFAGGAVGSVAAVDPSFVDGARSRIEQAANRVGQPRGARGLAGGSPGGRGKRAARRESLA